MHLEDELGDILQKARDGKAWSRDDLVRATDIAADDIQRIESYDLTPSDSDVLKLAKALDLDG
ncbi:MAG: helix-turn-helix domain-containing protein, partial [Nitrospinaceae bacterium]